MGQCLRCCHHDTSHCESSPVHLMNVGLVSTGRQLTLRPSQPTWAASPPVGCYDLHPPLPFIITQPESWYSFTLPQRVEGWVDLGTQHAALYNIIHDYIVHGCEKLAQGFYMAATWPGVEPRICIQYASSLLYQVAVLWPRQYTPRKGRGRGTRVRDRGQGRGSRPRDRDRGRGSKALRYINKSHIWAESLKRKEYKQFLT